MKQVAQTWIYKSTVTTFIPKCINLDPNTRKVQNNADFNQFFSFRMLSVNLASDFLVSVWVGCYSDK